MSDSAKKTIYYPVLFAPAEFEDLQTLAVRTGRTKADVIRRLVVEAAKAAPPETPLITPAQVVSVMQA